MNVEYFTKSLRCELTEPELLERSQTAARLVVTIDELDAAMKAEAKRRKAVIEEEEAKLRRISAEIRDKATFREIDCERTFDYRLGVVRDVRTDTGEVLNERAMTYSERQLELGIDEAPATSPTEPAPPADDSEAGAIAAAENEGMPPEPEFSPAFKQLLEQCDSSDITHGENDSEPPEHDDKPASKRKSKASKKTAKKASKKTAKKGGAK